MPDETICEDFLDNGSALGECIHTRGHDGPHKANVVDEDWGIKYTMIWEGDGRIDD